MKTRLMLVIAAVSLLVGCQTPTPDSCASAEAAYGAYLIYLNSGEKPSQEQIMAAQLAAEFLRQNCGWTADGVKTSVAVVDGVRVSVTQGDPKTDGFGVPIVKNP